MFKGSIVAIVTPFKNNEIDYNRFETLLNFHLENETDGILLLGTTGESPSIASDEREQLINFANKIVDGKVPLIVGTGSNNLHHTISMTSKAREKEVDAALVITPYYNKPTQNGLYKYFAEVASKVDLPIIIYNVPGRTGVNISAETTVRLAANFTNIVGIKEASGDLVQASKIVRDTDESFCVLSGEDAVTLPLLACGAKGVISVTANVVPQKMHDMVNYALKGDFEKARKIHLELLDLHDIMFVETNPIPVKEALYRMNMIEKEYRLPICEITKANKDRLDLCLKQYKLI